MNPIELNINTEKFQKEHHALMMEIKANELKKEIDDNSFFSNPPEPKELIEFLIDFLAVYTELIISNYNNENCCDKYDEIKKEATRRYLNDHIFRNFVDMATYKIIDKAILFKNKWIEFIKV